MPAESSKTATEAESRLLRFGIYELDPSSGELRRQGRLVQLAHQPFKVLWLLASRAGEAVSREEIHRHVWGQETHVDFERGLNFCILQIRRALGDNARTPRFIETLPRRGYRLIGPVETIDRIPSPVAESDRRPMSIFGAPVLGALALLVVAIALTSWFVSARRLAPPLPPRTDRVMLAVLPFQNLSGDPRQEYFSDGLTEEMIAQLGGLDPERLGVIARTTMQRYKHTTLDIAEIGREVGVGYVLEGSVRREAERVRITAQLIEVDDQTHTWAQSYDRNKWGALVIQRDVSRAVAHALRLELLSEEQSLPDRAGSHEPAAHDAYLRGRSLQQQRTREQLEHSLEHFERAIRFDADFALPLAAAAETYHLLAMSGAAPPSVAYPKAKEAAWQALEIAPNLAEAHLAAGRVTLWYDWDREEAERRYHRALAINPSLPEARHELGWLLIASGRTEEGRQELERARQLDPATFDDSSQGPSTLLQTTAQSRAMAVRAAQIGDPDRALEWLEAAFAERQPFMMLLGIDSAFEALQGDPRLADLLKRLGLDLTPPPDLSPLEGTSPR